MRKTRPNMISALSMGSTKCVALIAEMISPSTHRIVGCGQVPSRGIEKGVVVNIEAATAAAKAAVEEAEVMAEVKFPEAYVSISGAHLSGSNEHAAAKIAGDTVSESDIKNVMETAQAIPDQENRSNIHVLEQAFTIDGQAGIRKPLDMSGNRLEVDVHVVSSAANEVANIERYLAGAGIQVHKIFASPLAAAETALTKDEKTLGVAAIDIGAETCDVSVFKDGSPRLTAVVPTGAIWIDRDIANMFHIPVSAAEKIKREHGQAIAGTPENDQKAHQRPRWRRADDRQPVDDD